MLNSFTRRTTAFLVFILSLICLYLIIIDPLISLLTIPKRQLDTKINRSVFMSDYIKNKSHLLSDATAATAPPYYWNIASYSLASAKLQKITSDIIS